MRLFFEDKHTINLLTEVLSPYSIPTAKTRASFDTQTSAIHITPKPNGWYDINEVKEDSLWLSKEVGIEEIGALRIVILEWQARPATSLLQEFEDRNGPGMDMLVGSKNTESFLGQSRFGAGVDSAWSSRNVFDSVQARRLRLLEVYLSERQYLSICADLIIFRTLYAGPYKKTDMDSWGISLSANGCSWLKNAGEQITNKWKLSNVASTSGNCWVVDAIVALERRMQNIGKGSGWLQDEDTTVEVELGWCQSQLTDILHILNMILALTISDPRLTRSDVFRTWFKFMDDYGFFEQFELVSNSPRRDLQQTNNGYF